MIDLKAKFKEWQIRAEEDELAAKRLLGDGGPANPICFHAQQMAEKYLKGYLVARGKRFPKVHQLELLLELCAKVDPAFEELLDEANYLTTFYSAVRYPGDYPIFSLKDAKKAIELAVRIKDFVLAKISK